MVTTIALGVVSASAFLRGAIVVVGGIRSFLGRRRFERARMGWPEMAVVPEPVLLLAASVRLFQHSLHHNPLVASAGVLLEAAGWLVIAWTFRSWPSIHVGHGLTEGQKLITTGAYGWVRHPVYLGAFLIWSGLAVGYWSPVTAAITVLYVIPAYVFYARSEEAMMLEEFGDTYRRYATRVPGFLPRIRRNPRTA